LKPFFKALLPLLAVGFFYLILTYLIPIQLQNRLFKSIDIKFQGDNKSPFFLGKARFAPLTLERGEDFILTAAKAQVNYDPSTVVLGRIKLRIQAEDLTLVTNHSILNFILSEESFKELDARITVFSGKGVQIHELTLEGENLSLRAQGKLLKEGVGTSDLKATLWIDAKLLEEQAQPLVQDLLTRERKMHNLNERVKFDFLVSGDLLHPLINLQSDLIKFSVKEKEVVT
jgi:hypothetical protein